MADKTDKGKKGKEMEGTLAQYFGEGTKMSDETLNIAKSYTKRTQGRRRGSHLVESLERYEKDKLKKEPK
jgi:hypothetical protein